MVVEIDVCQHPDFGSQQLERSIRLVTFRNEPSASRGRVPAELRYLPADEECRIEAKLAEAIGDHRGRRRLSVGARDHDRPLCRDQLGKQLAPAPPVDQADERCRDHRLPAIRRRRRLL